MAATGAGAADRAGTEEQEQQEQEQEVKTHSQTILFNNVDLYTRKWY